MRIDSKLIRDTVNERIYTAIFVFAGFLYFPTIYNSFNEVIQKIDMPWPIAELLINYEGGFVRRGLLGQVALWISRGLNVPYLRFYAIIFMIATLINFCNLYYLLGDYKKRYLPIVLMVVLGPSLLMFPVYDVLAYFRKEILFVSVLLTHASILKLLLAEKIAERSYRLFCICVLSPALVLCLLLHELQIFLIPAHLCLTVIAFSYRKTLRWSVFLCYVIPVAAFLLVVQFSGTELIAQKILQSWDLQSGQGTAIEAIGWTMQRSINLSLQIFSDSNSVQQYALGWVLAVIVPSVALGCTIYTRCGSRINLALLIGVLVVAALSTLPLYYIGWDYGRWISITSWSSVSVALAFPMTLKIGCSSITSSKPRFSLIATSLAIFYVATFALPHCCFLQNVFKSGLFLACKNSLSFLFHTLFAA